MHTFAAPMFATATVSVMAPAFAATADLATQLHETQQAARQENDPAIGRTERMEIDHNLDIAASYARLGEPDKAQEYLSVARAELGLPNAPGAIQAAHVTGATPR
jgi:hypothetical protein